MVFLKQRVQKSTVDSESSLSSSSGGRRTVRRASSSLTLTNGDKLADVGTIKELDDAVKGARAELLIFTEAVPPEQTTWRAVIFGACVYNFRFILQWLPFTMAPFTRSVVYLGGLERVYLLVVLAHLSAEKVATPEAALCLAPREYVPGLT